MTPPDVRTVRREPPGSGKRPALELRERRAKVERLRAAGIDPFPHAFPERTEIAAVRDAHDPAALEAGTHPESRYRIAGRLVGRRGHGKATFIDVRDRSGSIQVYARLDALGADAYRRALDLDVGDIVGVDGCLYVTRRGQLALSADSCVLVAKALRAPPEKYHGLEQRELRYRHRELDLIANERSREVLVLRAQVTRALRDWMDSHGFLEVDPPVLERMFGGASARPFVTQHHALSREVFLRISSEIYLKRFIVGGLEKVYDLGRFFRNEGISPRHSPEFTMLEWMHGYIDYMELASFVEQMVSAVAQRVLGTTQIRRAGELIDLAPPWRRLSVRDGILEATGVDVAVAPPAQIAELLGARAEPAAGWARLVNAVHAKLVEPSLIQPTIVYDFPAESLPLTKLHPRHPELAEGFDAVVGGIEIVTGASELNDPDEQRQRLAAQDAEGAPHPQDEDFLRAMEYGMAPMGGAGLGVDRLVMLLAERRSLREVMSFPTLRARND